jgi:squalene-associated FAD-dependent desaturase
VSRRVVIIGGGFSGLAAGVYLSEAGYNVLLLERRSHFGGRAYSFADTKTGDVVDNGQHLFMGCYENTIAFLEKINRLDRLKFQPRPHVDFLDDNGFASFDCPPLPAPLHAVAGLLRMKGLTSGDKLRSLRVGRALGRNGHPGNNQQTVSGWLDSLGQSERIKERFWYPMAIATLNSDPRTASARMMKVVLEKAFAGGRSSSNIGIARVGLSDLYTDGATQFIESRGGCARAGVNVKRLVLTGETITAVECKDGEMIEADYFVSAATASGFMQILPDELRATGEFASIDKLESSPIVSINLWLDRPVIDREFAGLIGTRSQWIFNKDLILKPARQTNQIAVVISAARDFVDWSREALVEMALSDLNRLVPASRGARLVHSLIVKEREATLSHTVASDSLRPDQRTSIRNLVLAGDWVNTGLPATIEGAVLSGANAARIVRDITSSSS